MEILIIMSEGDSFYIRNKIYPLSRGSIFILNSSDLHRSVAKPRSIYQYYSIRFYPEEIQGISTENFDLIRCFRNHEKFNHMVRLNIDQLDHLLKLINKISILSTLNTIWPLIVLHSGRRYLPKLCWRKFSFM